MIISTSYFEILNEYDSVPILELVTDKNGSKYVALAIREITSVLHKYLVVSISDSDYSRYTSGGIDLLELVSTSNKIYKCVLKPNMDFQVVNTYESILQVDDEYLPRPGYYHEINYE